MKNIWMRLLPFMITAILIPAGQNTALAKKPPWVVDPQDPPPVSAPEPLVLTLIGMGGSGLAGYYLGKRKKKEGELNRRDEQDQQD